MPVTTKGELKIWQRRDRAKQFKIWFGWLVGVAIFMFCWKIISDATTWFFVFDAPRIAADIGGRAWPPRWWHRVAWTDASGPHPAPAAGG